MLFQVYLSIGTNINRVDNLTYGLEKLHEYFGALQASPVYESEAVGFQGDDFYNLVVGIQVGCDVAELQSILKSIEKQTGRDHRAEKFSARTLDIDILTFSDYTMIEPIRLPRDEIMHNAFVLKPLADIAPYWVHPEALKTATDLWLEFDQSKQRITQIIDPIDMARFS